MVVLTKKTQKEEAFTIVELLIVVVVIAILASVTIIGYNGIQQRAVVAKAASTVSSYKTLLLLYKTQEGDFPDAPSNSTVCLGPPDDYPASGVFQDGECAVWQYAGSNSHSVDPDFNDMLEMSVHQVPGASMKTVSVSEVDGSSTYTDVSYRGALYQREYNWDEEVYDTYIHYFLNGTETCAQGEAFHYSGITECIVSLDNKDVPEDIARHNGGEG